MSAGPIRDPRASGFLAVDVVRFDVMTDLARVALLHRASLPNSLISELGARAVERYYTFLAGSVSEHVLVVRADGVVEGACVVSRSPLTMMRRFAVGAPRPLIVELMSGLVVRREMRRRFLRRLAETAPSGPGSPEVTQIFTDARLRGRGLGRALLRATEDHLRTLGERSYRIHTLRDDNDPGIRFYLREGFTTAGTTRSFGDHYLIMTKGLT